MAGVEREVARREDRRSRPELLVQQLASLVIPVNGVPTLTPKSPSAIAVRVDAARGVGSTVYFWEGAAWRAI